MPNSWSWIRHSERKSPTPLAPPAKSVGDALEPDMTVTIPAGELSDAEPINFDPKDHTVDEVKDHVAEYPDTWQAVYDREAEGKGRVTLLAWLQENKP